MKPRLQSGGERALLARIFRALGAGGKSPGLLLGPGDDAALIAPRQGMQWVVTCDSFCEQTHFLLHGHPPDAVGYKALARAASDLATMGATPRFYLLAMALPPALTGAWLNRMLTGMARAARHCKLRLAGGDTSAQATVSLSLTVIGEAPRGFAVTRGGARPGHRLFVSGTLGEARLGLELTRRRLTRHREAAPFLRRHCYPEPRIELGCWLARNKLVSAMIDLSDGLSTDLHNLCRASGVGACIQSERLPAVAVPRIPGLRADALKFALHGGDDYELLFAVSSRVAHRIPASYRGLRLTCIGEVTRRKSVMLQDAAGKRDSLRAEGWDPFRTK